jgi:hypothetical protein
MSGAPFVASLRARESIVLSPVGGASLTIRAQLADAWDAVRVSVSADDSVLAVKLRALEALDPGADAPGEYMVTYRGVRIPDENASLAHAGIVNGGTVFIAHRHRRPVR